MGGHANALDITCLSSCHLEAVRRRPARRRRGARRIAASMIRDSARADPVHRVRAVLDAPPSTRGHVAARRPRKPRSPNRSRSAPAEATSRLERRCAATLPTSPLAAQLPPCASAVPSARRSTGTGRTVDRRPLAVGVPSCPSVSSATVSWRSPTRPRSAGTGSAPSPGRAGSTVLVAHVSWADTIGPFFRLGSTATGRRHQHRAQRRNAHRRTKSPSAPNTARRSFRPSGSGHTTATRHLS